MAHNESIPPNLRKVIDHIVDSIILMGRVQKQISADSKEGLKPIRALCDKKNSDSKYLFPKNLLESMKGAQEFQIALLTTLNSNFKKLVTSEALSVLLSTQIVVLGHGCSPVNFLHIFRTHFLRNTSGWLLVKKSHKY